MALPGGVPGGRAVIVATWEEFLAERTAAGPPCANAPAV